jgi:hypothetical protein
MIFCRSDLTQALLSLHLIGIIKCGLHLSIGLVQHLLISRRVEDTRVAKGRLYDTAKRVADAQDIREAQVV